MTNSTSLYHPQPYNTSDLLLPDRPLQLPIPRRPKTGIQNDPKKQKMSCNLTPKVRHNLKLLASSASIHPATLTFEDPRSSVKGRLPPGRLLARRAAPAAHLSPDDPALNSNGFACRTFHTGNLKTKRKKDQTLEQL